MLFDAQGRSPRKEEAAWNLVKKEEDLYVDGDNTNLRNTPFHYPALMHFNDGWWEVFPSEIVEAIRNANGLGGALDSILALFD